MEGPTSIWSQMRSQMQTTIICTKMHSVKCKKMQPMHLKFTKMQQEYSQIYQNAPKYNLNPPQIKMQLKYGQMY